jgi:hypothetical protein
VVGKGISSQVDRSRGIRQINRMMMKPEGGVLASRR